MTKINAEQHSNGNSMTRPAGLLMTAALLAGLLNAAALAHHSTQGIYNEDVIVELTGTVKEWRFINPHPTLVIEVIGAAGEAQEWDVSYGGAAVPQLRRRGFTEDTFMPGDVIQVRGYAAKVDTAFGLLIRGDPTTEDGSPIIP